MLTIKHTSIGLDLGQRNDHTAVAIIDLAESVSFQRDPVTFEFLRTHRLLLRGLRRLPLGTLYTDIPEKVRESIVDPPPGHLGPRPRVTLAIDAGGPGLPVVDLFRQARYDCGILPAIITGVGVGGSLPGGTYSVPRRELVSLVRIALESGMLVFPADLPLKKELALELKNMDPAGGQSQHDDMAVALALALWGLNIRFPGVIRR